MSDEFQSEGGEDPVRRRELLARAAGLAGAAAFGLPVASRAQALNDPGVHLDDLLYGSAGAEPVPPAALRTATTQARACFQAARYERLMAGLPPLIAPLPPPAAALTAMSGPRPARCSLTPTSSQLTS